MARAMSFEAAGKTDSAHIEYKKLIDALGRDGGVARRAWQNAMQLGRTQDAGKFKKLIESDNQAGQNGELVVFLQTGTIYLSTLICTPRSRFIPTFQDPM